MMQSRTTFDVIVVGAGSSGCALAARLSEDGRRSVLLVEAGPRFAGIEALPPELRYGSHFGASVPGHPNNWGFVADLCEGVQQPLSRGRVVGGSSAINGTIFTRGLAEDFKLWAALGGPAWSYDEVLPFYRRLERDLDMSGDHHGTDGPVPVVRVPPAERTPVSTAFLAACDALGFSADPDMNAPGSTGAGPLPMNNLDGLRVNCALAYLDPANERPNLSVMSDAMVTQVLLEGRLATGILVERDARIHEIRGREVVLSAGAVKSPQLLMVSGIGPADELIRFGIEVRHDLPQVGRNFTDHCTVHMPMRIRGDRHVTLDPTRRAMAEVALHYTAPGSLLTNDMMIMQNVLPLNAAALRDASLQRKLRGLTLAVRQLSWAKLKDQILTQWDLAMTIILMQGNSRGRISLTSSDSRVAPRLEYHYLEDAEDRRRLREAMRLAARLIDSEPYRALGARRTTISDEVLRSDALLDAHLRAHVGTSIHMASSCRMGQSQDDSVVDQYCRVHGIGNLRVVDTSIMPNVVRRCPNATAVMIGERAAQFFV